MYMYKIRATYLQRFFSGTSGGSKPRVENQITRFTWKMVLKWTWWCNGDGKSFAQVTHIVQLCRHCVHWDWLPQKIVVPHLRTLWWKQTSQVRLRTHQRSVKVRTSNFHLSDHITHTCCTVFDALSHQLVTLKSIHHCLSISLPHPVNCGRFCFWCCNFLWSPYGIGQTIIFSSCGFFFLFFPRLISAIADWISAILLHMVWP